MAHERVLVRQPYAVRARVLARARQALGGPRTVRPLAAPRPSRARGLVLTHGGGGLLAAGTVGSFEVGRQAVIAMGHPGAQIVELPLRPSVATGDMAPVVQATPEREPATVVPLTVVRAGRLGGASDERRLLSRARDFDARGDYDQVLDLAIEHEHSHPTGQLTEEREALRLKALVGTGQESEARRVGAKFRRRFPRSVLLSKVDQMLASLDQHTVTPVDD